MYKFEPLQPKPEKIIVTFQTSVTLWESNKSGYGKSVEKVVIENPDIFTYHTYGKGMITYYAEWFGKSVRPLKKFNIQFDTLQIKSIKFVNKRLSISSKES